MTAHFHGTGGVGSPLTARGTKVQILVPSLASSEPMMITPLYYLVMTFSKWKCDGFTEGFSWKNWSRVG